MGASTNGLRHSGTHGAAADISELTCAHSRVGEIRALLTHVVPAIGISCFSVTGIALPAHTDGLHSDVYLAKLQDDL